MKRSYKVLLVHFFLIMFNDTKTSDYTFYDAHCCSDLSIHLKLIEQLIDDLGESVSQNEVDIAQLRLIIQNVKQTLQAVIDEQFDARIGAEYQKLIDSGFILQYLKENVKKLIEAGWFEKYLYNKNMAAVPPVLQAYLQAGDHDVQVAHDGVVVGYDSFGKLFKITVDGKRESF